MLLYLSLHINLTVCSLSGTRRQLRVKTANQGPIKRDRPPVILHHQSVEQVNNMVYFIFISMHVYNDGMDTVQI